MKTQESINYERIAKAINYIQLNFREQPSLEDLAEHVHLSTAHFHRMFTEWAGTSPKKFLQYTSLTYAKSRLRAKEPLTLFETTFEIGLSSSSRLHDLFVSIEGMSPAEYKQGGRNLEIDYSFSESPFGRVMTAATEKGLCLMVFEDDASEGLVRLAELFPNASLYERMSRHQESALRIFSRQPISLNEIKLHLKGTEFQLKIWEALLQIQEGDLSTYGKIASEIGNPLASRAVGTAIGANPISFLIPCHRVIQSSGLLGGYRWGLTRKIAMIGWEASFLNQLNEEL